MDKLPMTNEDKAWTAGIIDGEGCIGAYIRSGGWGPQLTVMVGNTEERMLTKLKELWGGKYRLARGSNGGRFYWQWRLQGKKVGEFLFQIRPYLIVKDAQADVAIEFSELIRKRGGPAGEVVQTQKLGLAAKLKQLKRR